MKTNLFLIATLFITTIAFSQTSNKAELVDAIAKDAGLSKADAGKALNPSISKKSGSLKKGNNVQLIGFGTTSISKRAARAGRNPQTGATIKNIVREPGERAKVAVDNDCDDDDYGDGIPTQTGAVIKGNKVAKFNVKQEFGQTKGNHTRQRPLDGKLEAGDIKAKHNWATSRSRAHYKKSSKQQ
jgi:DNA-binding protein HU-beta